MTKNEMIKILVEDFMQDKSELEKMSYLQLKDFYEELVIEFKDDSVMYPNGRDED